MGYNVKLACLVVAAVLVLTVLFMNRETMHRPRNRKLAARKRPVSAPATIPAVDTVSGSTADMGNIVYMEPVDPNLLQIAATGRTY